MKGWMDGLRDGQTHSGRLGSGGLCSLWWSASATKATRVGVVLSTWLRRGAASGCSPLRGGSYLLVSPGGRLPHSAGIHPRLPRLFTTSPHPETGKQRLNNLPQPHSQHLVSWEASLDHWAPKHSTWCSDGFHIWEYHIGFSFQRVFYVVKVFQDGNIFYFIKKQSTEKNTDTTSKKKLSWA